jgi:TRAP-type mannitol/chloroaromatic compound transport system permease large subunit
MESLIDALPFLMAATLAVVLFAGYPVALTIAAVGFLFFAVGYALDLMPLIALFNLPLRMYSNLGENLIYPAVPMLLFMGIALERSGVDPARVGQVIGGCVSQVGEQSFGELLGPGLVEILFLGM